MLGGAVDSRHLHLEQLLGIERLQLVEARAGGLGLLRPQQAGEGEGKQAGGPEAKGAEVQGSHPPSLGRPLGLWKGNAWSKVTAGRCSMIKCTARPSFSLRGRSALGSCNWWT